MSETNEKREPVAVGSDSNDGLGGTQIRMKRLEEWLEGYTYCPCCTETVECEDGCTFANDDPEAHAHMTEVRELLRDA